MLCHHSIHFCMMYHILINIEMYQYYKINKLLGLKLYMNNNYYRIIYTDFHYYHLICNKIQDMQFYNHHYKSNNLLYNLSIYPNQSKFCILLHNQNIIDYLNNNHPSMFYKQNYFLHNFDMIYHKYYIDYQSNKILFYNLSI